MTGGIERIALIEVGHHHAALIARALRDQSRRVVAVSDRNAEIARRWADAFGCARYDDHGALLRRERVDFAFAFGVHRDMPAIARALLEAGVPFSIEKPGGLGAADVEGLCAGREATGLFVSVPLVFRCSPMLARLRALAEAGRIGVRPLHMRSVDLAGSPRRYDGVAPWLTDPAQAGGGCFINLAPHFTDMFVLLGGDAAPEVVGCRYGNAVYGLGVEDHAVVLLANAAGGTCSVEVGYTFPDDARRFQAYSFAGAGWLVHVAENRLRLFRAGEEETFELDTNTDNYYPPYVRATLAACASGGAPVAGPRDLLAVMRVADRANALGAPQLLPVR